MKLGLFTGGGHVDFSDALLTIINAQRERGNEILASIDGWKSIGEKGGTLADLTYHPTEHLRYLGGSFIGTSRTNPDLELVVENVRRFGIDALLALGGEDTLSAAREAYKLKGIPIVGWPKTMDNDGNGSYATIGYATAAEIASNSTFEAFRLAYSHSKIVLVVKFGRNYDWVSGAAADYGHADYVIPAERTDLSLEQVGKQIKEVYEDNRQKYGRPFAVVAVSEGAGSLIGLKPYIDALMHGKPVKYDQFGHPKIKPEIVGLALEEALAEYTGIDGDNIAIKVLSYHLRDPNLNDIDRRFAIRTAEECVRLIDKGDFGKVATIQDPRVSGFLPDDTSRHINAYGSTLYVGNITLDKATEPRPVRGTGFFDYEQLRPTNDFTRYLFGLLGIRKENPRQFIHKFAPAKPL